MVKCILNHFTIIFVVTSLIVYLHCSVASRPISAVIDVEAAVTTSEACPSTCHITNIIPETSSHMLMTFIKYHDIVDNVTLTNQNCCDLCNLHHIRKSCSTNLSTPFVALPIHW